MSKPSIRVSGTAAAAESAPPPPAITIAERRLVRCLEAGNLPDPAVAAAAATGAKGSGGYSAIEQQSGGMGLLHRLLSALSSQHPNTLRLSRYGSFLTFLPLALLHALRNPMMAYMLATVVAACIPGVTPFSPAAIALPVIVAVLIWLVVEWRRDAARRKADRDDNHADATVWRCNENSASGKDGTTTNTATVSSRRPGGDPNEDRVAEAVYEPMVIRREELRLGDIVELSEGSVVGADVLIASWRPAPTGRMDASPEVSDDDADADGTMKDDADKVRAPRPRRSSRRRIAPPAAVIVEALDTVGPHSFKMEKRIPSALAEINFPTPLDLALTIDRIEVPIIQQGDDPDDWEATVFSLSRKNFSTVEGRPLLPTAPELLRGRLRLFRARKNGSSTVNQFTVGQAHLLLRGMRILDCGGRGGKLWGIVVGVGSLSYFGRVLGERPKKLSAADRLLFMCVGGLVAAHHVMLLLLAFVVGAQSASRNWALQWFALPYFGQGGLNALPLWFVAYAVGFVLMCPVSPILPIGLRVAQLLQAFYLDRDVNRSAARQAILASASSSRRAPSLFSLRNPVDEDDHSTNGFSEGTGVLRLDALSDACETTAVVANRHGPITSLTPAVRYLAALGCEVDMTRGSLELPLAMRGPMRPKLAQLCVAMSMCHAVFPATASSPGSASESTRGSSRGSRSNSATNSEASSSSDSRSQPKYVGENQEEVVLAELARSNGVGMTSRTSGGIELRAAGAPKPLFYQVLAERKPSAARPLRVIVCQETVSGDVVCFAKGRPSAIWPLLDARSPLNAPHESHTRAVIAACEEDRGWRCVMYANQRFLLEEWGAAVASSGIDPETATESQVIALATSGMLMSGVVALEDVLVPGARDFLKFITDEKLTFWLVSDDSPAAAMATLVNTLPNAAIFGLVQGTAVAAPSRPGEPIRSRALQAALQGAIQTLADVPVERRVAVLDGPGLIAASETLDELDDLLRMTRLGVVGDASAAARRELVVALERSSEGSVLYVGDGVIDIAALRVATVGFATMHSTVSPRVMSCVADVTCETIYSVKRCLRVHTLQLAYRLDYVVRVAVLYGVLQALLWWTNALWELGGTTPFADGWVVAATTLVMFLTSTLFVAFDAGAAPLRVMDSHPAELLPHLRDSRPSLIMAVTEAVASATVYTLVISAGIAPMRANSLLCGRSSLSIGHLGVLVQALTVVSSLTAATLRVRSFVMPMGVIYGSGVLLWLVIVGIFTIGATESTAYLALDELGGCAVPWGALAMVLLLAAPCDALIVVLVSHFRGERSQVLRNRRCEAARSVLDDLYTLQRT